MTAETIQWAKDRTWFYRYQLPDGSFTTTDSNADVLRLHDDRRAILNKTIDREFGARAATCRAIDFASHEGWFSFAMAAQFRDVRGVDMNPESVSAATRMADILNIKNAAFRCADVRTLEQDRMEPAEMVLIFGLLYHLEDPIRILRIAASLSTQLLVIETQVTGLEIQTDVEFGSHLWLRRVQGNFLLIDDDDNREGGNTGLALIPSIDAIQHVLMRLGFKRVEVAEVPPQSNEQLVRKKRAIIVASRV